MPMTTDELLRILACPKCLSPLRALEENDALVGLACPECSELYPVRDGIPIMLIEDALNLDSWNEKHPNAKERS